MKNWHIIGGNRLSGSITVQGAKNAVLPIMAASILADSEVELLNVPELRDVDSTVKILQGLGCAAVRDRDSLNISSKGLYRSDIPHELMREMRSSVFFLGALLARCGEARLSIPGGCELGPRPIDLHLMALRTLGAEITEENGDIVARSKMLRDARIDFPSQSVGATENAMLAACAAEGVTIINNAAREPEIEDLQNFLIEMGAKISGAGTATIVVEGFSKKSCVGHRIMPDRIAASTLLCAAAATYGDLELRGVSPCQFQTVLSSLAECGCEIHSNTQSVRLRSMGRMIAPQPVVTGPYPAFPTDAQPIFLASCLKASGTSVFVEKVFSNRYRFVSELLRMGAKVHTEGSVAVVTGVKELYGAPTTATDLRGGAALVIAGLTAKGETQVLDTGHIERGYDSLDKKLCELGAILWITSD